MADLHFDPTDPARLWLGASTAKQHPVMGRRIDVKGGLFRSDDGGATWRTLDDKAEVVELAHDPVRRDRMYGIFNNGRHVKKSDDGGETWTEWMDGLVRADDDQPIKAVHPGVYKALAVGPDFVLTASTEFARFYRLPAGGDVWETLPEAEVVQGDWYSARKPGRHEKYGRSVSYIAIDPRDPDRWFFTDWYALYETRDAGKTFTYAADGVEATVTHILRQDPADPGLVYLGMADNGVLVSANGGEKFALSSFTSDCKGIDFSALDRDRLYAIGPDTYGHRTNQLYLSLDRGQRWRKSPMNGLNPPGARFFTTVAVVPENPRRVYLALAGDNEPGGGGVHRSDDGGASFVWDGAGMPAKGAPFWGSNWGSGRELAAGPGGGLVAVSQSGRRVHWRAAPDQPFRAPTKPPEGQPFDVAADPQTPGRFFVGSKGSGVWRSDDGGDTWTRIYDGAGVTYVAVDLARPERVAAARDDHGGIVLSRDGGDTWEQLDASYVHRRGNQLAFAGDRLLVGSNGNGVFWIPVEPEGEAPVVAQPFPALFPAQEEKGVWGGLNGEGVVEPAPPVELPNPSMTEGEALPAGWAPLPGGRSKVAAARDTEVFASAPASLRLSTVDGPANGSVFLEIPAVDAPAIRLTCRARAQGANLKATVNVQCLGADGRQLSWKQGAYTSSNNDWRTSDRVVPVAEGAQKMRLIFTVDGEGSAWIDDLVLRPGTLGVPKPPPPPPASRIRLQGQTEKNPLEHAVGEEIAFVFTVDLAGERPANGVFVAWTRTGDDGVKSEGRVEYTGEPVRATTALAAPGFVRLAARLVDRDGKPISNGRNPVAFNVGAGADVDGIEAPAAPEDFDAFWAGRRALLDAVPVRADLKEISASGARIRRYAVRVDCAGDRPVTGVLSVPADAADGALPAIVRFAPHGPVRKPEAPRGRDPRRLVFDVNPHGYALDGDDAYYRTFAESIQSNGRAYAQDPAQNARPDTAYFHGMALRALRAVEYLQTHPAWNGRDLTVAGEGMGGTQALWCASQSPAVSRVDIGYPWCCDVSGAEKYRRHKGWRPAFAPGLSYYDGIHHAPRIQARVDVDPVGLTDDTCPPAGAALLLERLSGPRSVTWVQGALASKARWTVERAP